MPYVAGVLSNGETLFDAANGRPVIVHVITSFVSKVCMFLPWYLLGCEGGAAVKQAIVMRFFFGKADCSRRISWSIVLSVPV